jgi:hypothetical protein
VKRNPMPLLKGLCSKIRKLWLVCPENNAISNMKTMSARSSRPNVRKNIKGISPGDNSELETYYSNRATWIKTAVSTVELTLKVRHMSASR